MSGIFTNLRKLGVNLVGQDGFLTKTGLAMAKAGPLDILEMKNKGIEFADKTTKDAEDLISSVADRGDKALQRKYQAESINSLIQSRQTAQELERERIKNEQEKDAADTALATKQGFGSLADYRASLAETDATKRFNEAHNLVSLPPELGSKYKTWNPNTQTVSKTELQQEQEREKAAAALNRINITAGNKDDNATRAFKLKIFTQFTKDNNNNEVAINNAEVVHRILNEYKLGRATRENIAVMLFQKGLDAASVVRNEEYARLLIGAPLVEKIKNTFRAISEGGQVPESIVLDALKGLEAMATIAKDRQRRLQQKYSDESKSLDINLPPESFKASNLYTDLSAESETKPEPGVTSGLSLLDRMKQKARGK
jgi:hypothetical protein